MQTTTFARQARRKKADHAAAMGIDDALISDLVETFYERVRADSLLGPIFTSYVRNWPVHLARMKDFWSSIAIEAGRFRGNPMLKHIAIGSLERRHFERWLAVFFDTIDDLVPGGEARHFFRERASRIAESLLTGIEIDRHGIEAVDRPSGREKPSC